MASEPTEHGLIGLREAAARLGVHYMTAYRYVRLGTLPAVKSGGTWRVRPEDLAALRDAGPAAAGAGGLEWDRYRAQLVDRLRQGDEPGAWAIVERALTSGAEPADVHVQLTGPALRTIGDRWAAGEVTVAEEHRASAVAARLVARLGPRFARPGRRRGTVVVGAAPGDRHGLPTAILADLLRGAGLDTSDLGADTPVASFVEAVRAHDDVVAVAISVGCDAALDAARDTTAAVHAALPGVTVFVGGPAVEDEPAARRLGADEFAASATDLVNRCVELARRGPTQVP